MATINKKVWLGYFDDLASGKKKFELRLNDFEVHEGDTLVLQEWNQDTKEYTGRQIEKKVTYVLKTKDNNFFTPEDIEKYGYQAISLE